jgi:hypothetical protein
LYLAGSLTREQGAGEKRAEGAEGAEGAEEVKRAEGAEGARAVNCHPIPHTLHSFFNAILFSDF